MLSVINFVIFLVLFIGIIVGAIFLQIFLSKKENKWTGLILPLITLCIAILVVSGLVAFTFGPQTSETQTINEKGEIISKISESTPKEISESTSSIVISMIFIFILYNIPTVILLAIYASCREKIKKKNIEIERMNIIDLE